MTPAGAASASPAFLDGLLVVDLSRLLPGPLVARLLSDLGARVIKVEEPKLGDPVLTLFQFGLQRIVAADGLCAFFFALAQLLVVPNHSAQR